jgi:hypothetical protein
LRHPLSAEVASPRATNLRLLIVEPDVAYRELLLDVATAHAHASAVADFGSAFDRLSIDPPDLLVTNLLVRANVEGLQLAYLAASIKHATRTIVYSDYADKRITYEIQRAGAFFETPTRLVFGLPSYIDARLPRHDRRDPYGKDRRTLFRGGRRASDVPAIRSV